MARTTVDNLVGRVRRRLAASLRGDINVLSAAITTTNATTFTYTNDQASMRAGAIVCIDLELMYVVSVSTGTKTATVIPSEIAVNPIHSNLDIIDAAIAEIDSWGPHLYQVVGERYSVADFDTNLELDSTFAGMYGTCSVTRNWTIDDSDVWPTIEYRFQRGVGTTWTGGAPVTGLYLRFIDSVSAGFVYVTAAVPFVTTTFTMSTDLVTTVGLQASQMDVLELGIMMRLLGDNDAAREGRNAANQPGLAEAVPVGSTVQPRQLQRSFYISRKNEEIMKMRALYPVRYS
jgi:hypothetical protein